jgi:hypothetical protein
LTALYAPELLESHIGVVRSTRSEAKSVVPLKLFLSASKNCVVLLGTELMVAET